MYRTKRNIEDMSPLERDLHGSLNPIMLIYDTGEWCSKTKFKQKCLKWLKRNNVPVDIKIEGIIFTKRFLKNAPSYNLTYGDEKYVYKDLRYYEYNDVKILRIKVANISSLYD